MVNEKKIPSRVITFYSYKGGVGRSMAMANIGVLMASWKYKVLLIDWDLEAPGMENYFCHHLDVAKVQQKKGLIDLLHLKAQCDEILVEEIPWKDYINHVEIGKDISLDLLTAGKRDEYYFNKVRQFDYTGFYNEADGGQYLENLREYWLEEYDFVLIDSRTGLTDSSGICSIHMPDILVLLFTPNEQSFNGIKEVARKAIDGQKQVIYDRFRLRVLPIPSRIENAETQLLDEWMKKIYTQSADMLEWLPKKESNVEEFSITPDQVIGQLKIPYKTFYAYGERLSVIERGTLDPHDLGYVYENIAAVLVNDLQNIHLLTDARDLLIKKAKGEEVIDYSDLERKFAEEQDAKARLEEELRKKESLIEEKAKQNRKKKSAFIWIAIVLGLLIAAVFYFAGINNNSGTKIETILPDVLAKDSSKDRAGAFATAYSTSDKQGDLSFNLAMAQQYYQLDAAYQDSFKNIKSKIEFAVAYRFQELADSFYLLARQNPDDISSVLAGTVRRFGALSNIASINIVQIMKSSVKAAAVTNMPVDTSFDLQLDPEGYRVTYMVNGNTALDKGRKYKRIRTNDVLLFDNNLKLIEYSSEVLDSVPLQPVVSTTTVELLICGNISKMDYSKFNSIVSMLKADKDFNVSSKMNFSSSKDAGSPYYFSSPMIKYSDPSLQKQAMQVQEAIKKASGYNIPVRLQRSSMKNYITAYLCPDQNTNPKMDIRQQAYPASKKG